MIDLWIDTISEALDICGANGKLTDAEIRCIAESAEMMAENYSMLHGHDTIRSPMQIENQRLKEALQIEQRKDVCPECKGKGREISYGGTFVFETDCFKCRGTGFVDPHTGRGILR